MTELSANCRVVRASAGTGKTYSLTTRYLALLRAGVEPTGILATTFTRKAAGEIFERVLTRLANAVLDHAARTDLDRALREEGLLDSELSPLDDALCGDMLERLVDRLDRAAIGTIDGFFARLCGAFALELGLPVDPTLTDDGSALAAELRETAIEAMLGEAADDGFTALLTLLRQLHHDTAKRSVTGSLDAIFRGDADGFYATFRQARDAQAWPALETPGKLEAEALLQLAAQLAASEPFLPTTKSGQPNKNWSKALAAAVHQLHIGDWAGLLRGGLVKAALGDGTYYRTAMPPELHRLCEEAGTHASAELIELLNLQHRSTWELLDRFAEHFERTGREQRVMFFADLTDVLAHRLRPQLGHADAATRDDFQRELAYRLDGKVEHLLIDEFQDTSVDQFGVLWPLMDEATNDATSDRTLFVVGDTKQSIYGWRGGRVELFDSLETRLEPRGLESRRLDRSYRSSNAVLDAVNRVFDTLRQTPAWEEHRAAKQRFADDFVHHVSARPELPGEFCVLTTSEADDNDEDKHGHATAIHLRELTQRWPEATIGVLVRTNAQAERLLQHTRDLGLAASGETGAALTDHPAVRVVLAALTLADHPDNSIAAFQVAQSPLGVVLDLAPDNPASARRVSAKLRRDLAAFGVPALLAHWIVALAPACDEAGLRRLRQLARTAEAYRPVTPLRPWAFVRFVEAARVEDPSADRLRIMTVHRAKGLEFDAVVLPFLHTHKAFAPKLLEERPDPAGPIAAVYRAGKAELRGRVPKLTELFEDARSRHAHEQLCTLYVAMTRARFATHVLAPPSDEKPLREGGSMLALLWHALVPEGTDPSVGDAEWFVHEEGGGADARLSVTAKATQPAETEPSAAVASHYDGWPLVASSKPARPAAPSPSQRKTATNTPDTPAINTLLGDTDGTHGKGYAAAFGTRVHAGLQAIGFADEEHHRLQTADNEVDRHVRDALEVPAIFEALSRLGAAGLRRELPLTWKDTNEQTVHGVIDRLVWWTDEPGRVTRAEVQDFKTDRPPDDFEHGHLETWLTARRAHHAEQMEHYRRAAARWLGLPEDAVGLALLFTSVGRVVRW